MYDLQVVVPGLALHVCEYNCLYTHPEKLDTKYKNVKGRSSREISTSLDGILTRHMHIYPFFDAPLDGYVGGTHGIDSKTFSSIIRLLTYLVMCRSRVTNKLFPYKLYVGDIYLCVKGHTVSKTYMPRARPCEKVIIFLNIL